MYVLKKDGRVRMQGRNLLPHKHQGSTANTANPVNNLKSVGPGEE